MFFLKLAKLDAVPKLFTPNAVDRSGGSFIPGYKLQHNVFLMHRRFFLIYIITLYR